MSIMLSAMRREIYRGHSDDAWQLFDRSAVMHLVSLDDSGAPLFRTLNYVRIDETIYFHGAKAGDKAEALGQAALIAVEEIITTLPSYFVDRARACPATTLYRSAHIKGLLEEIKDPSARQPCCKRL